MENYDMDKLNAAKPQQELPAGYAPDQIEHLELCEACERLKKNYHLDPNNSLMNMIECGRFDYETLRKAATKFTEAGSRGL